MNEVNINTLCRICLSNSYLYSNIYVGQSTDSFPIYEVINYVYDLEISVDDGLPEYVCQECLSVVRDFKIYKTNAHKARSELILLKQKMERVHSGSHNEEMKYGNHGYVNEDGIFIKEEDEERSYFDGKSNEEGILSVSHGNATESQEYIKEESYAVDNNSDIEIISPEYQGNLMEPETCIREGTSEEESQFNAEFRSAMHSNGDKTEEMMEGKKLEERPKRLQRSRQVSQRNSKRLQAISKVYSGTKLSGDFEGAQTDGNKLIGEEDESEFKESLRKKRGPRSRKCTVCGLRFNKPSDLSRHQMTHSDEMPYQCPVCKKRFREKGKMNKHQLIHDRVKFECEQCGMKFLGEATLAKHQTMHKEKKSYECTECGKVFTKHCHLTTHLMMHRGERPYECPQCGKRFREKSKLNKHEMIHTGERAFGCEECGRRFTYKYNLDAHKVVHLDEKPFGCTLCGRRFGFKKYLIRHQMVHSGEKQLEGVFL